MGLGITVVPSITTQHYYPVSPFSSTQHSHRQAFEPFDVGIKIPWALYRKTPHFPNPLQFFLYSSWLAIILKVTLLVADLVSQFITDYCFVVC